MSDAELAKIMSETNNESSIALLLVDYFSYLPREQVDEWKNLYKERFDEQDKNKSKT